MTIQSQTTRVDYTGNGATTNFPVPFYWLQDTDLLVIRTDNAYTPPTVATLALTTDYVVTGSGNQSGGSITTTVAPTATQKLSILRNVPFTQLTHYVPNDPFPAASHEQALDKLTMETQQLNEGLSRSITLPPNATGLSTNLPLPVASQLIGWNPTATALQNVDPTTIATSVVYGNAVGDKFSGDGTTVNFNLSANPGGINNLDVSISGVTQRPGIDYTWTTGTTLTFVTAPPSGTNNILVRYTQALPIGLLGAGQVTSTNLAAGSVGNAALAASAVKDANVDPAAAIQPTKITYQAPGTGSVVRDLNSVLLQTVSLFDFIPLNLQASILNGTINPATTDLSSYLSAAATWAAALAYPCRIEIPRGLYPYSTSPNWAIPGLVLAAHVGAVFKHTGTGVAFKVDGGASGGGVFRVRVEGGLRIAGNSNSTYGLYVRAVHHSYFDVSVRDVATAGLRTEWTVCNEYRFAMSPLAEPAFTVTTTSGMLLGQRNSGEATSACTFYNPIIEGITGGYGINLQYAVQNVFVGGTSESNAGGLSVSANSTWNRFINLDMEFNTTADIFCLGLYNVFDGCLSSTTSTFGGLSNLVIAGTYNAIVSNGTDNEFIKQKYAINGGAFSDSGTGTIKRSVRNVTSGTLDPDLDRNPHQLLYINGPASNNTVIGSVDQLTGGSANDVGYYHYGSGVQRFYVANVLQDSIGPNTRGFYGAAPVAKQTVSGAKGGNAALGSLLTALANLGLITDSTSA